MESVVPTPPTRLKSCQMPDICRNGDIVKNRWRVLDKLGAGTFGQVYRIIDLKTKQHRALKVESKSARKPVLRMDVVIAKALKGKPHSAEFFACGHEPTFSYMVSELLGRNLAARKRSTQEGRFPLRTVIRIGVQSVQALRDLHEAGFIHRDVKPSNLATGVGEHEKRVYLLDFGLARKFLDDKGHIYPPRKKVSFRGTIRYGSPKAHLQQELGRGDDVWSLFYSLIELYADRLPWHNIRDLKRVGESKLTTTSGQLCRGLPPSWIHIGDYCREMTYEVVPNYQHIARLMNNINAANPSGIVDPEQVQRADWEWDVLSSSEEFGTTM